MTNGPILELADLAVEFRTDVGIVRAVDGVSLAIHAGETLGIVGESGSGKSVTALAILGLVRSLRSRVTRGRIQFGGQDLVTASEGDLRHIRGGEIAMVFQDPMTSLNPVLTIGRQITETLELHMMLGPAEARIRAVELLDMVGIPSARSRIDDYPHQFSGGMRQRVMIAMAVSCRPKVLIADEPTTALDVTIQAQILELIRELQAEIGMALILITHDLGVVAGMADRMAVMYAGRIVEEGPTETVFADPRMPYTIGLLDSIPRLDDADDRQLVPISGQPLNLAEIPAGCAFAPRCRFAEAVCQTATPLARPVGTEHRTACLFDIDRKRGRVVDQATARSVEVTA